VGTWFKPDDEKEYIKHINKKGTLVLFSGELLHYAPPNTNDKKRITLGLTFIEDRMNMKEIAPDIRIEGEDLTKPLWEINKKKSWYIFEDENEMEKRK
jgi:ectoine hydroxylase-related dioxygenase (phytanoyl-CoA dioxygenase family)